MYTYRLNTDKKPLSPVTPAYTRKLLESGKAKILNKNPFIIQSLQYVYITNETENISMNVYLYKHSIDISVISESGRIYYSNRYDTHRTMEGIFCFIRDHIPVNQFNFFIRNVLVKTISKEKVQDYLYLETKFISDLYYCAYCFRELELKEYQQFNIIDIQNFPGNSLFVCYDCLKRFENGEISNYHKYIYNFFSIFESLIKLQKTVFEERN